jgi:hypothetical protein
VRKFIDHLVAAFASPLPWHRHKGETVQPAISRAIERTPAAA